MIKVLHTADWHLGRTLYSRKRYDEFEAFLQWLNKTICHESVDVLLVAGDIFDSTVPSNRAQELYYKFLHNVATSPCRHVIIVGGNHDSPSFLNAPKELLKSFNIHVIGSAAENYEDEVLVLKNQDEQPELIICAVPYLRDRDIRIAEVGESNEDKERKLIEGIRSHYLQVVKLAEQKRKASNAQIPIVATGHLFAAGGQTVEGDGVRELYVGSLAHVSARIFPENIDYLALGHLHVPQKIGGSEIMRYSGSPIPLSFGETKQQKCVCLVEFIKTQASVKQICVPIFQELERIRGNLEEISAKILQLATAKKQAWLEIVYEGDEVIGDLRERLDATVAETEMEILAVKNNRIINRVLNQIQGDKTLDDLTEIQVFERCLTARNVPDAQRYELFQAYQEIVKTLLEEDSKAE